MDSDGPFLRHIDCKQSSGEHDQAWKYCTSHRSEQRPNYLDIEWADPFRWRFAESLDFVYLQHQKIFHYQ